MEVVVPIKGFHFDSTSTSPYVSAPSSPKSVGDRFDYYFHYTSAPTSPSRAAAIYAHFNKEKFSNNPFCHSSSSSAIPFDWEVKPGTPKSGAGAAAAAAQVDDTDEFDFAFDFSGQLEKGGMPPAFTTADELFEEGKIRPLKPPPRLYWLSQDAGSSVASTPQLSPKSPRANGFWSPRNRGRGGGVDPFAVALEKATRDRGRDRAPLSPSISASRSRKGSRSLSPMRGLGGLFAKSPTSFPSPPSTSASTAASLMKSVGRKKWRLRDLLLFRSASEGRVTGNKNNEASPKYTILSSSNSSSSLLPSPKKRGVIGEDSRNSSFRSTASNGSVRKGSGAAVSPHEMHYTTNKAASEELKKKTPLPYRQGLFGCLLYNPAINRIVKGFSSNSFSRRRS